MEQFSIVESSALTQPVVAAVNSVMCKNLEHENLHQLLDGANIVFVELSPDTSMEIAGVLHAAEIAKDKGALTIAVFTEPLASELELTKELNNAFDSIVLISREAFRSIPGNVFTNAVKSISGVVLASGDNDINLDIEDLKIVMSHYGLALMGAGEYTGDNAAVKAVSNALTSVKADDVLITNARAGIVHFNSHPEFPFREIASAMDAVHQSFDYSADIIFGTTTNDKLPIDYICVTIVATGFEKRSITPVNNVF